MLTFIIFLESTKSMRLTDLRKYLPQVALLAGLATVAACSDQATPPPVALVAVGDFQFTGTVAERIPSALTVRVNNAQGSPVNGVAVTFVVADGGGSLTKVVDTTRSGGVASTNWTLGQRSGTQRVTAAATGLASIDFTAVARAGAPTAIAANGGDGQSVVVGTAVLTAPGVIVRDRFTNPVSGVSVIFSVANGGGTITGSAVATNSAGIAAVTEWKMGATVGTNTLTALALASGIVGNPVTFTATATAGAASRMTAVGTTTLAGTVFKPQVPIPQVKVTDASGNAVAGAVVTFTGSAGSTVVGGSKTTDAAGLASPDGWALGTLARSYTLTATSGTVAPVTFTAAGLADVATTMTIVSGSNQTALAGRPVAVEPSVKVTDVHGNAVAGIDILFEVASGGGAAVGRRATTNAQGVATVGGWTLGDAVGSNTLVASVQTAGVAVTPVTFSATGTAGAAATMSASAGQTQTVIAGAAVGTAPSVIVRDARGNPVAGVSVTFVVGSGGGTVTDASVTTLANGSATVGSWVLGGAVGPQTLVARSANLPDVTFTATATAGSAALVSAYSAQAQSGVPAGTALSLSQRPAVRVTDAQGNAVGGIVVTFTVDASGASGLLTGGLVQATATTNSNGIATVGAWTVPTAVGTATAVAAVAGIAETVSFTVTTIAGAASAVTSSVTAGSLAVPQGGSTSIIVTVRDVYGNLVLANASGAFSATRTTVVGADGALNPSFSCSNGACTSSYSAPAAQAGTNRISVSIGGVPILDSPITIITTGPASELTSTVTSVLSLAQSASTLITVTVKDVDGNVLTAATAGTFVATVTNVSGATGVLGAFSCASGVCTALYTAPGATGTNNVNVTIGAVDIVSSPRQIVTP